MQTEARLREVVKRLGVDDKVRRVLRRVGRKSAGTPTTGPDATPGATPGGLQTGAPGSAADDEN
jgi:hypothetical protein